MQKDQNFSGVLPPNPHQGSAMNPLQSLQHLKTPTCILQKFKNSIFVQKGILVKLLGQMLALRLISPVTILMIGDVLIYRDWLTE